MKKSSLNEIMTDKGQLTTRHRSMIKATPKVNIEANIVPAIVDDPDDDSKTPDPTNIWSQQPFMKLMI